MNSVQKPQAGRLSTISNKLNTTTVDILSAFFVIMEHHIWLSRHLLSVPPLFQAGTLLRSMSQITPTRLAQVPVRAMLNPCLAEESGLAYGMIASTAQSLLIPHSRVLRLLLFAFLLRLLLPILRLGLPLASALAFEDRLLGHPAKASRKLWQRGACASCSSLSSSYVPAVKSRSFLSCAGWTQNSLLKTRAY